MTSEPHCPDHPDEEHVHKCQSCGRVFCDRCQAEIDPESTQCPTCFSLDTTALLDAGEWTDWPDLL